MKRSLGFVLAVVVLAGVGLPVEATTHTDRMILDLTNPGANGGVIASRADVAVYLMPFDAPDSFTPKRVAFGKATSDGRFSFSLLNDADAMAEAAKTATDDVNILIRAINEPRTWMVDIELAVPLRGTRLAIEMDERMNPAATEGVSAEDVLKSGEVIVDTPPPGFSCSDFDVATRPAPYPGTPDGSPPWDGYSACEEEQMEAGAADGYVTRFVKFMNLHVSRAMSGRVLWEEGRGSRYQIAYRFCWPLAGGCGIFRAGAMTLEDRRRSTGIEIDRTGPDHQMWRFEYTGQRRRRCVAYEWRDPADFGKCKKMKRYWVPYEWTWGHDPNAIQRRQPKRPRAYDVPLANGATIYTQEHKNKVFGGGVSLFGLSLDAQANYSEITALSWTGLPGCRDRFIYGANSHPRVAPEIFARSRGCR